MATALYAKMWEHWLKIKEVLLYCTVFQEETPDEYPLKQDPGSSESDLELGMYPAPDEVDEDSSMDSLGI